MLTPDEIISKLKPCHYRYNDKKDLGDKINFGFIAQDILEDFGEEYNFVTQDKEGVYLQVNYYQFIAPIVSVVKEQQKEIKMLREELQALKENKL